MQSMTEVILKPCLLLKYWNISLESPVVLS
jgi:hypothetical protein